MPLPEDATLWFEVQVETLKRVHSSWVPGVPIELLAQARKLALGRRWLARNRRLYTRGRSWRGRSAGIAANGEYARLRPEDRLALGGALRRRWLDGNRRLYARGGSWRRRSAGITAIADCAWFRPEDEPALGRPTGRAVEHPIGKPSHVLVRHHCRHGHRLAARHATHQSSSRTQIPHSLPPSIRRRAGPAQLRRGHSRAIVCPGRNAARSGFADISMI